MSDDTGLRDAFLLDPEVTFLNHGSFGACPRAVLDRYQEWQLELERQPVLFLARRLEGLLAEARAALAAYVGADPDDLVFVPNVTAGVKRSSSSSNDGAILRARSMATSPQRNQRPVFSLLKSVSR